MGAIEVSERGGGLCGWRLLLEVFFDLPLLGGCEGLAVAGDQLAVTVAVANADFEGFGLVRGGDGAAVGVETPVLLKLFVDVAETLLLLALFGAGDQMKNFESGESEQ